MRALTLTQPWAGLVASGIKLVENRPRWMIKREDFGVPFAIHASREIDERVYGQIEEIHPPCSYDIGAWAEAGRTPEWYRLSRITSAVIAVATIERVFREWTLPDGRLVPLDDATREEIDLGDQERWFFGPIGYVLRDVRALATPVPCRGWQGFWTLPADVEAQVREQLGVTP